MNFETSLTHDQLDDDPFAVSDEERRLGRRRVIMIAGAMALVLIALWFMMHRNTGPDLSGADAARAPSVSVVVPGRAQVVGTISSTGSLAALREMPVGSVGEGGAVAEVLVEAGQWVKAGQVLAVIDRSVQVEQRANQAAQIQASEADARLAQANLDRASKLVERGFISKAEIDRLTALRDGAAARVRVARAQLGETNARIGRLYIRAPAGGLLLERNVEPGQVVGGGGTVLFRIAREGRMELRARLAEADLAQLAVGQEVAVTPVGSSEHFTGHIWQLSPTIDPATRQGTARVELAYAPAIRPGGFATAEIRKGSVLASVLPESAIMSDAKGAYVYVVEANNKVSRRAVKLGDVTGQGIVIRDGLNGSERVVLRAGAFLSPGDAVKPVPARAN
ncbi:MAG: efflux RND transporter periplasmic adaptor subunit [Proteobacteria bacterium]|nr:efflux RND transporter periplasmic adaptor subunit [Pseudomonadota bacterium]